MRHTVLQLTRRALFSTVLAATLPLGLLGLVGPALPCAASDEAPSPAPLIWRAGNLSVHTLLDRHGTMPAELFSGPATPEQRLSHFPGGQAPSSVSTFLIRDDSGNILVDTGYGESGPGKSGLLEALKGLGLTPADIDVVLLTHMHMDHIGGLLRDGKRAFPKARIAVSLPEQEYWVTLHGKDPNNGNAALVSRVIEAYGGDFSPPFALDSSVLPGVTAIGAVGHTPGHTVFQLEADGKKLLIIGDLVHAAALQFPLPEECARYDLDKDDAVAARKKILTLAADKDIPVAGMHLPFPAAGMVGKDGAGFVFRK